MKSIFVVLQFAASQVMKPFSPFCHSCYSSTNWANQKYSNSIYTYFDDLRSEKYLRDGGHFFLHLVF